MTTYGVPWWLRRWRWAGGYFFAVSEERTQSRKSIQKKVNRSREIFSWVVRKYDDVPPCVALSWWHLIDTYAAGAAE